MGLAVPCLSFEARQFPGWPEELSQIVLRCEGLSFFIRPGYQGSAACLCSIWSCWPGGNPKVPFEGTNFSTVTERGECPFIEDQCCAPPTLSGSPWLCAIITLVFQSRPEHRSGRAVLGFTITDSITESRTLTNHALQACPCPIIKGPRRKSTTHH